MLDRRKMEAGRVGDGLEVLRRMQVVIVSGNGRKLPFQQIWDGWWERIPEIGVLGAAAVARPEAGVYSELHEVGEPSDLLGSLCFTTGQGAKLIQVDRLSSIRNQIGVDEREVGELILGIVVDILGHVRIQHAKGLGVGSIPTPPWDFAILDASQFVVLLPKIGFEGFERRQEAENVHVSLCETATALGEGRER